MVRIKHGVLLFGEIDDAEHITNVHRNNIDTEEKRKLREAWENHYVSWCLSSVEKKSNKKNKRLNVLSLGCGLGIDILRFLSQGHNAYGLETADMSNI